MFLRNSAMVMMIFVTILDIARGNRIPFDQLVLWDAEGTKEVRNVYQDVIDKKIINNYVLV